LFHSPFFETLVNLLDAPITLAFDRASNAKLRRSLKILPAHWTPTYFQFVDVDFQHCVKHYSMVTRDYGINGDHQVSFAVDG